MECQRASSCAGKATPRGADLSRARKPFRKLIGKCIRWGWQCFPQASCKGVLLYRLILSPWLGQNTLLRWSMEPCCGKSTKRVLFSRLWRGVGVCFGKSVCCVGSVALSQPPAATCRAGQGKVGCGKGRGRTCFPAWRVPERRRGLTPCTSTFLLWLGQQRGRELPSIQSPRTNGVDFEWIEGVRSCSQSPHQIMALTASRSVHPRFPSK